MEHFDDDKLKDGDIALENTSRRSFRHATHDAHTYFESPDEIAPGLTKRRHRFYFRLLMRRRLSTNAGARRDSNIAGLLASRRILHRMLHFS